VVAATAGRGVDHVLETVGGASVGRSVDVTAIGGRISLIGVLEGFDFSGHAGALMLKQISIQGVNVAPRGGLERFGRFVDEHGLKPVIDATYDFADLPAALDHLDRGAFGKIVLTV
jgi:NADPH:quinone reductase-like Zn-dependent oxidoreductase